MSSVNAPPMKSEEETRKKLRGPGAGFEIRIVLTISALVQIYTFAGVVLWSLNAGQSNLALPVVVSFFSTVIILFILAVGEVVKELIGWRRRFLVHGTRLYVSLAAIVPPILLTIYGGSAILQALSITNLTPFAPEVRYFASFGIALEHEGRLYRQ